MGWDRVGDREFSVSNRSSSVPVRTRIGYGCYVYDVRLIEAKRHNLQCYAHCYARTIVIPLFRY